MCFSWGKSINFAVSNPKNLYCMASRHLSLIMSRKELIAVSL